MVEEFEAVVQPDLVAPVRTLLTWAFIFCFFSIGLTTRFRELASAGAWPRPSCAFTSGVVANVIIGFVLAVLIFGSYWATLGTE